MNSIAACAKRCVAPQPSGRPCSLHIVLSAGFEAIVLRGCAIHPPKISRDGEGGEAAGKKKKIQERSTDLHGNREERTHGYGGEDDL